MAKYIGGHGASVRSTIDYLTKDGRSVATDYINCWEIDRLGRPVWRQMDECRHALCGDTVRSGIASSTWLHIVVSPDPRDRVDLATLRDLARSWARRHFGAFQVAIYYHDDNALRIPHAHLVVNNANLERPGRRVSSSLGPAQVKAYFQSLQEMAKERGLSPLVPNSGKWRGTAQATYRSKHDLEIEAKGISWKQDVRDRISCAIALSTTERDYVEALGLLGLSVRVSESEHTRGEYVYRHPAADFEVLGMTLGRDWSREGIAARLERDRVLGVDKPCGADRERLLEALSSLEAAEGAAVQVLGVTRGVEVTSRMVADMVTTCVAWDVRSVADMDAALAEAAGTDALAGLEEASRLARALGHLPKARAATDGERVSPVHGGPLDLTTGAGPHAAGRAIRTGDGPRDPSRDPSRDVARQQAAER